MDPRLDTGLDREQYVAAVRDLLSAEGSESLSPSRTLKEGPGEHRQANPTDRRHILNVTGQDGHWFADRGSTPHGTESHLTKLQRGVQKFHAPNGVMPTNPY